MDGFEKSYCDIISGKTNIKTNDRLFYQALEYCIREYKIYREILDNFYEEDFADDYFILTASLIEAEKLINKRTKLV